MGAMPQLMGSCDCGDYSQLPIVRDRPYLLLQGCAAAFFALLWLLGPIRNVQWRQTLASLKVCCRKQVSVFEEQILEAERKRRLTRFELFTRSALLYVTPVLAAFTARASIENFGLVTLLLVYVAVIIFSMLLILYTFPWLMKSSIVDVVFSLAYLLAVVPPPFASSQLTYRTASLISLLTLLYLSQIYPNVRMACVLNCLSLAWQLGAVFLVDALRVDITQNTIPPILAFVYSISTTYSTATTMRAESEALIGEREARWGIKSVKSLLEIVCDAVVILKPDLSLWQPCLPLVSMLLRNPTTDSMGREFAEYLAPGEAERFTDWVRSNSADGSSRTLRIDLLDSMGRRVPVRAYHTCTRDHNNIERHMVGLVEDAEPEQLPRDSKDSPSDFSLLSPRGSVTRSPLFPDADQVSAASSNFSGLAAWTATGEEHNVASVTIKTRLQYEIVNESLTSENNFGFSKANCDLVDQFLKPQPVLRWLEFVHSMAVCGTRDHPRFQLGKVKITNSVTGIQYQALLRAKIVQAPPTIKSEDAPVGPLDLSSRFVEVQLTFQPPKIRLPGERKKGRKPPEDRARHMVLAQSSLTTRFAM